MGHNSAVLGGTSQGNRYHRLQQRNKRMKEVTAARALLEFSQQQDIPPTHLQHDEHFDHEKGSGDLDDHRKRVDDDADYDYDHDHEDGNRH